MTYGDPLSVWTRVLSGLGPSAPSDAETRLLELTRSDRTSAARAYDRPFEVSSASDGVFGYQRELMDGIARLVGEESGAAMIALPTGGGKTRTAIDSVLSLLRGGASSRVIWLAPSHELLQQALDTMRSRYLAQLGSPPRIVVDSTLSATIGPDLRFSLVTTQALARASRDQICEAVKGAIVVVDEAHLAGAQGLSRALEIVKASSLVLVGLSATPGRADDSIRVLCELFDEQLIVAPSLGSDPVRELQDRRILSQLQFHTVDVRSAVPGLAKSRRTRGRPVNTMVSHPARFEATIEMICAATRLGRALVFAYDVAHGVVVETALREAGISAEMVIGDMPDEERGSTLDRFAMGQIDVLLNVRLLTAGYDLPALPSVVLATPIESAIQFEQIVGRVVRGPATGGTAVGNVWQLDDHLDLHGHPRSYARFLGAGWRPTSA